MKSRPRAFAFLALCLFPVGAYCQPPDFTGFWKANCSDAFGVQIKKQPDSLFSVSFCGPGGCFEPGQWTPNTPIIGDPKYRIINATTLEIARLDRGWDRYTKCTTDTNPVLDYANMPAPSAAIGEPGSGVVVFEPNQGLPDYTNKSPFTANSSISETLRRRLAEATASPAQCKVAEVVVPNLVKRPLFSNVCDKTQSDALRKLVAELAPDLTFATTAVWKVVAPGGEAEPLVTHVDISTDEHFHYPYLSIWRLEFKDSQWNAQFAGSFLSGQIYAIRPFGHENNSNKVFVKYLSCIECEPWVYLSVLDFSQRPARPIMFTYDLDHKEYGETIEYELPGMGHSVEADVETRVPKGDAGRAASLPDLIQTFRYKEEDKVEWWLFSCQKGQCDYQLFYGALPEKYRRSWASADKL